MIREINGVPSVAQVRRRSRFCSPAAPVIPQILADDGLTTEMLAAMLNEYLHWRMEPEELMYTDLHNDWNSLDVGLFVLYVEGVRFLNSIDSDDESGEATVVYSIAESDKPTFAENKTFAGLLNKWEVEIKETCWFNDDTFSFVVEFSSFIQDGLNAPSESTINYAHGIRGSVLAFSFQEGAWYNNVRHGVNMRELLSIRFDTE